MFETKVIAPTVIICVTQDLALNLKPLRSLFFTFMQVMSTGRFYQSHNVTNLMTTKLYLHTTGAELFMCSPQRAQYCISLTLLQLLQTSLAITGPCFRSILLAASLSFRGEIISKKFLRNVMYNICLPQSEHVSSCFVKSNNLF